MVYLAWTSDPFGKKLARVFGTLEKGEEWLETIHALRIGSVYHKEGLLVRHDTEPDDGRGIDYGYTWFIEKREVE
jgi:hypothetical protein